MVRLALSPRPAVQGLVRGTVISFVRPVAVHPAVAEPATAAINRPMIVAKGPPAMITDCFAAAISAVLLLGAALVTAALQLDDVESGFWFSLPPPKWSE